MSSYLSKYQGDIGAPGECPICKSEMYWLHGGYCGEVCQTCNYATDVETIPDIIRSLIRGMGIRVKEVAQLTGVTRRQLRRYMYESSTIDYYEKFMEFSKDFWKNKKINNE